MKARRIVAALTGFLLAAAPALRAGASCSAAQSGASMSAAMEHHAMAGHDGHDAKQVPAKSCDSHESDCCAAAGCATVAFLAGNSLNAPPRLDSQVTAVVAATLLSAPLTSLDPPPPRA